MVRELRESESVTPCLIEYLVVEESLRKDGVYCINVLEYRPVGNGTCYDEPARINDGTDTSGGRANVAGVMIQMHGRIIII